jgi:hypothetical protein
MKFYSSGNFKFWKLIHSQVSNECILVMIRSLRVRSLLYRKMLKILEAVRKHKLIKVHFLRCVLALQVKIRNWMHNVEATELVGVSAHFG